jgi:hypothetical protein
MATRTPTAAIVIYSYSDRGGSSNILSIKDEMIIATKSIVSISTQKTKASPAGSFVVELAPTRNWIATISPGSWIEIHMSPDYMKPEDIYKSSSKTLKMIGRIDSVRMNMSVDQQSGARRTVYTLEGKDWGQIFESMLYIDPYITNSLDDPFYKVIKLLSASEIFDKATPISRVFSPSVLIKSIIRAWGSKQQIEPGVSDISRWAPLSQFVLPLALAAKIDKTIPSYNLADNIKYKFGRLSFLSKKESYEDSEVEATGVINPNSLVGVHNIWQILTEHSAHVVNEMFCDMRWEGDKPQLSLFKRPRPFWLSATPPINPDARKITSPFFNLKRTEIPKDLIISIDAGDNWRDLVNFIEVMPDYSVVATPDDVTKALTGAWVKKDAAVYDNTGRSFARNGLKPLMFSTTFMPPNEEGVGDPGRLTNWLPVLKHWYFDAHKMLNGSISFMGLGDYIGVGENISVDASVLGMTNFVKNQANITLGSSATVLNVQLVAHIESVSHKFYYAENGSRSYTSNIGFVRGVFSDPSCSILTDTQSFGIDTDANALSSTDETIKNTYEIDVLK